MIDAPFEAFLDDLYATATGERPWADALGSLAGWIGASAASMALAEPQDAHIAELHHAGFPSELIRDYLAYYEAIDPRRPPIVSMAEGELYADSEIFDPADMGRMPFYEELLRPHGLRYALVALPRADRQRLIVFALSFPGGVQPDESHKDRLRRAMPHLRRAVAVDRALRSRPHAPLLAATLDCLPNPVALLDAGGHVLYRNQSAERVLQAGKGLALTSSPLGRERLRFDDPGAAQALLGGLLACRQGLIPPPLLVRSGEGAGLTLLLAALPEAERGASGAVAILLLFDPQRAVPSLLEATLRGLYAVTASEAALLRDLAAGRTLRQHAASRHIDYETARTLLKRAMGKTGISRQSDLVRHLAGIAAALPADQEV